MDNQNSTKSPFAELEPEHPADPPLQDDDVVITGMSSLMPGCQNLKEWSDKLYKKVNMVTSDNPRWKYTHPELSQYQGKVSDVDRFDAQFFMVNAKIANVTDPGSRIVIEQAHKALFDAGVCPVEMTRKPVGVFIAMNQCEGEKFCSRIPLGLIGCNRTMFANRISYWMNVTGPSFCIDSGCAGSVVALERAHEAMMTGQCEAAFVGAVSLMYHPMTLIHSNRVEPQNPDGKTKCYDINADGYSLSESVSVIYLQKYKNAKRVYARLCHVKTSFSEGLGKEFMVKFGHYRDPEVLSRFLSCFYEEAGVSPSLVEYVEGFGSANPDTDKSELQAIEEVFCKQRTEPLLVGSVTSNIGFTDVASGLNGIIKILHGYQSGVLAANLNCDNPRQDIGAIRDGRIKILTEHHPIRRSYAALNNFSITGMNAHVLLKGHFKNKDTTKYPCDLPYLVTVSGRQESGVERVLNSIKSNNLDPEEMALLRELFKTHTSKHLARGFGIYTSDNNKTLTLSEKVNNYDEIKRPLWFVYSGLGSQWPGMGSQLMSIPIFAATILRCDAVLKPKGIDIVKIITSNDKTTFDNILNAFVGITAIQIALTDVLLAAGLTPDNIIGHSLGELGCAYADNCLTIEETILLSYSRGLASVQLHFIKGSMAAVGLGYKEVSKLCPPELEVACHNGPNSSTLSGPAEVMKKFVKELTKNGIFAKEVECADIAYHSRYIAEAGPLFLKMGQAVIKTPKLRSKRWLSTSVPMEEWKQDYALYSSAEYHTNNLLSSVLFEETSKMIPNGAVLVEIAPHGLLQAILKRSVSPDCRNIPLTNRGYPNSTVYLLEALGKLYIEGCDVDTTALYPKVEFPVSTQTPNLAHLVEHNHTDRWSFCQYTSPERRFASTYKPTVTLYDDEHKYLKGSVVEGKREFPLAGIMMFVWDLLAMSLGEKVKKISVKFQDVRFYYQPLLEEHRPLEFTIMLQRGSGRFEVLEDPDNLIAEGDIKVYNSKSFNYFPEKDDLLQITSTDIYKVLYERGYEYTGEFKSIRRANISLTKAEIAWTGNWTTFIDGVFQLISLRHKHDGVSQPSCVKSIIIDINKHQEVISDNNGVIEASYSEIGDMTRCGGVVIKTVILKNKPARTNMEIGLKTLKFVPFIQENNNISTNLYVTIQIVAKHFGTNSIKILTINGDSTPDLLHKICHLLCSEPEIKINVTDFDEAEVMTMIHQIEKPNIVFIRNNVVKKEIFNELYHGLPEDTFLLFLGVDTNYINTKFFKSVFVAGKKGAKLELYKFVQPQRAESIVFPVKHTSDLEHLQNLRKDLSSKQTLTVVTTYPPIPGVKEIVAQLRAENSFRAFLAMINSRKAKLDLRKLHDLDLADNVFHGKWGGEYYVPLDEWKSKPENVALQIGKPGDLNSVNWVEKRKDHEHGIQITVHYAGLNTHDAKRVIAEISSKTTSGFGMDFSGLNERKEPVMGLVPNGAACNKISFKTGLIWPVPNHWSLEDAATVPLPYCLAFYCLGIKLKLGHGMNVLIHGGAGALGQAAISIALAHGCKIFTTVSDNSKKRFLTKVFPDLPAHHIGNSRDDSFRDMVQSLTKGEGCEIIISNVKGHLKNATLACCAMAGTTLDMVQIHERDNFQYCMSYMTKARSYCSLDFYSIFNKDNIDDLEKLRWMVSDGIVRGYVRPITRVTYAPYEAPHALRLLAASRHCSRVLLRLSDYQLSAQPRIICFPQSSYLIICDKEGFGFKLADKLVSSGAKKIHLHLVVNLPHLFYKLQYWKEAGVEVKVSSENLDDNGNLETLFGEMNYNKPVDGIFIIQDDTYSIQASVLLKLDDLSRKMCPDLRYFVIINGQHTAQYICHTRSQNGIPGVFITISLKKFGEENKSGFGWNKAIAVIEQAARAKEPDILAYVIHSIRNNIIEEIAKIPGVKILSSTVDRTTLEKIGIDHGRSQEFCNLMQNKFDFEVAKEVVPNLSIGQLKNWKIKAKVSKQEKSGIGAYFNYIHPDELVANSELVLMPTMLVKANMRADEVEIEDSHMFIVPGLEGHHGKFKSLCARLKIAAAVLQIGYDNQNETVQESAQRFSNVIMHKLKYKNHFYLLGYEYGVLIALEIAAILESYGLTGTVFCLGGSPDDLRADIVNSLNGMPEWKFQNELIQHFFTLASVSSPESLASDLLKLENFDDKIKTCIEKLQGQIPYNGRYLSDVIKSAYARIGFVRNYNCDLPLLKGNVVLIRALPCMASHFQVTASYELPVSITYALDDLECPAIINKHLEPHVLEDFYNRNLCESYLMNSEDAFMEFGLSS